MIKFLSFKAKCQRQGKNGEIIAICDAPDEQNGRGVPVESMTDSFNIRLKKLRLDPPRFGTLEKTIGHGQFGYVILVHNELKQYFAAKIIPTPSQLKRVRARREYEIMRAMHHPNIVKLYDAFHDPNHFTIIMEYLWGGEIFERIIEDDQLTEHDVINYVRQITEGLHHMHNQSVVHLDIKPENVVCVSPNSKQVKIIDLGMSRGVGKNGSVRFIYGSRDFAAPETLSNGRISVASDMWSFGVFVYTMLSGIFPFKGNGVTERSMNAMAGNYTLEIAPFDQISLLGRDFISRLLVVDVKERMTATEAAHHDWLARSTLRGQQTSLQTTITNLRSFLNSTKKPELPAAVPGTVCLRKLIAYEDSNSLENVYTLVDVPEEVMTRYKTNAADEENEATGDKLNVPNKQTEKSNQKKKQKEKVFSQGNKGSRFGITSRS